ncbi:MAG TPA: hypothetical protein PLK15_01825 [Chitinophagales bacterium]|nr:hypothetical protein [Chitinophagales bacterium]
MRKVIHKLLFGVAIVVFVVSCKKETDAVNFDYGYNYFPSDSGTYVIYRVDSVIYNDFYTPLKRYSSMYLKEVVSDTFTDNLGRKARMKARYITDDLSHPWVFDRMWYFIKTARNVEQVEDNFRYVKLTFPITLDNPWRGNKYNELKHFPFTDLKNTTSNFDWNYNVTLLNYNYTNGTINTDSTLTVLQVADSSRVQKVYSEERYAKNIGLIYKELWRLDAQLKSTYNFVDSATNGFIMKQYAIGFGKE